MVPIQAPVPEPENLPGRAPQPPTPFDDIVSDSLIASSSPPQPAIPETASPPPPARRVWQLNDFPDVLYRGKEPTYPATIANTRHLLEHLGISARYNTIKKKIEIHLPEDAQTTTDNADNVAMTHIVSAAARSGLPVGNIPAYVEAVADANPYNPVAIWITRRPWDGRDRLLELYETIQTRDDFPKELKHTLLYRWLLSAVAAALKPRGFKARGVLTFQGNQSIGKTSWIRNLINDEALRETVIKVDHHLDTSNKDTLLGAIAHWIVEIGELDSTFRKDVARLKGFLTSDQDKLRRPYARGESEYARRTVFAATVNDRDFLVDSTGNTRWWTLPVEAINYEHGIDMQQVFAQLAEDFHKGEPWWLTRQEEAALEECNRDHLNISAIREALQAALELDRRPTSDDLAMTASEVLRRVLDIERPTNPQSKECAACLRGWLGEPKKIKGQMKYRIPLSAEKKKSLTASFNGPKLEP